MKKISRETLAECLDLLEQGFSVEQVLARFPEESEALRPFLNTAVQLSRLGSAPTMAAERRSKQAVLRAASAARAERGAGAPLWLALRQTLAPALTLAVVVLLFGVALPLISVRALPGDGLYGAKRLVEQVQLILEPSVEDREALRDRFNEERIREVEALLADGREAPVQFEGRIGEIGPESWTVAGVPVFFDEGTVVEGEPWRGGLALVEGETRDGRLTATRLVIVEDAPPPRPEPEATLAPSPSPTETATATPTETTTPTVTATPTTTATPTVAASATSTRQPEASPTAAPISATPTPAPSATRDDGDDGNENGGDDDNENSGDDNDNENDDDNGNDNGNDNGDDQNENGGDDGNENGGDDNDNENDDDDDNDNEDGEGSSDGNEN